MSTNLLTGGAFDKGVWVERAVSGTTSTPSWTLLCTGATAYRYAQYLLGPGDIIEFKVQAKASGANGASVQICEGSLNNVIYTNAIEPDTGWSEQVMRYAAPIGGSSVLVLIKVGNEGGSSSLSSTFTRPRLNIISDGPRYGTYRVMAAGMVRSTPTVAPELLSTFSNHGVKSVTAENDTTFRVTLEHRYSNYGGTTGELRPLLFCSITPDGSPAKVATIGNFGVDGEGYAYCLIRAYEVTTGNAVVISPNTSGSQTVFIQFMIVAP